MDSSDAIQLLTLAILIFLSTFFSSLETALTTVNRIRIRNLAEAEDAGAIVLAKVVEDQDKMLSAILIGNSAVNLYASSLATVLVISVWGSKMIGVVTGILTLVILVFGEITPRTLATLSTETLSLHCAKIIYSMMMMLTPVIFVVNQLSMGVLFLLRIDPNRKRKAITEDKLHAIVEVSHEEGIVKSEEGKMVSNVFDFDESPTKGIMVPRIDMTFINMDTSYQGLIDAFREEKYTRIPVYEDTAGNVIGIINMKDLLLLDDCENFGMRNFLRQPLCTYEFKKTSELVIEMWQTFDSIVVVLDEYGSTAGLIALEDILEKIIGEIHDEYDEEEEESLVEVNPGEYLVKGSVRLDDLNGWLGLSLKSEDCDSIGSLVIGLLGRLPDKGEEVTCEGIRLVMEEADRSRIGNVRMFLPQGETREVETEEA